MQQIFIKAKHCPKSTIKKGQGVSTKQAWTKKEAAIFKTILKNSQSEGPNSKMDSQQREWDK